MTRLPYVEPAHFTAEQRELYDSIANGPRAKKRGGVVDAEGHLTGPFNGFLRLPSVGKHWSAIGETLRFRSTLPRNLFELAVVTLATEWRCSHEWAAHWHLARDAGISEAIIGAFRNGETPAFNDPAERLVFQFVRELAGQRGVSDKVYADALSRFGEEQVAELVNVVAYYTALATMLNGFAVKPPEGMDDPWP